MRLKQSGRRSLRACLGATGVVSWRGSSSSCQGTERAAISAAAYPGPRRWREPV